METTKIQLSEEELLLMQNSRWILTKNGVIDKISQAFGELVRRMQQTISGLHPLVDEGIILSSPKISRGEKYQGLPYVILDYPRIFGKEDILAIRTLFWWGNFCSITLHVKGNCQAHVSRKLVGALESFRNNAFYISLTGNEWDHDLFAGNYLFLHGLSREELERKLPEAIFLKLSAKVEIESWDIMEKKLYDMFLQLSELLKT